MSPQRFTFSPLAEVNLQAYRWLAPEEKARVIIVHGLGEHASRYQQVGQSLAAAGFTAIAYDQRGHGPGADRLGDFGAQGWLGMLADLRHLIEDQRGSRIYLLGHSMGSMLGHHFITRHSDLVDGVMLSGSPGFPPPLRISLMLGVARFERWRLGPRSNSPLIRFLLLGAANKNFASEHNSGFEWLSRDQAEVEKYIQDPYCGFSPDCGSTVDWFKQYRDSLPAESVARIRKDLPMYLFSGTDDPLHGGLKNIERQLQAYRGAGLQLETGFYPGGRHEMFHEINRDEVIADVLAWLENVS